MRTWNSPPNALIFRARVALCNTPCTQKTPSRAMDDNVVYKNCLKTEFCYPSLHTRATTGRDGAIDFGRCAPPFHGGHVASSLVTISHTGIWLSSTTCRANTVMRCIPVANSDLDLEACGPGALHTQKIEHTWADIPFGPQGLVIFTVDDGDRIEYYRSSL